LRLRTNLEIYWDRLAWAAGVPDSVMQRREVSLSSADLQHRGYSQLSQACVRAPEIPDYNHLAASDHQWGTIEGYYTRFGDVRPLLEKSDDRYVIAASGDELRLRFRELPAPVRGMLRDFVFVGDGWMKEGDYSFAHSATLLPLPYRGLKKYNLPLQTLEEDHAYKLHPEDWQDFHIRYLGPEPASAGLWK
jgi:hypothetical protein